MYTDKDRSSDLIVDTVNLQHRDNFTSHEEAKIFVEQTITQFQTGKWERYFLSKGDARVTGRSSLLDQNDNLQTSIFAPDPDYQISMEDWLVILPRTVYWYWLGDGIRATLSAKSSEPFPGETRPRYSVSLGFDIESVANEIAARNEAKELKNGNAKGWNSTAKAEAARIEALKRHQILEANAIQRGDRVVPDSQ